MSVVAIVGAGDIGAAAARTLVSRARVDDVRLIDEEAGIAAGKALDLLESGPISRSDTHIAGTTDIGVVSSADVIVLADAANKGEWTGEAGLMMMRQIGRLSDVSRTVVVCAGAAQRMLMQHVFDDLGLSRRRVIGSAPEALAATARALVAVEARAASNQVALTLIGRPPEKVAILWNQTSIAGHAVESLLSAAQLRQVEHRIRSLWPPAPGALGTAAALIAEAVATGSRRFFSAFVSLDRDNGTKAPVCAWPVSIGPAGLERVTTPQLTGRDRVVIDEVME